jgi:IclR family KDG regulon transcriptional repressor
MDVSNLNSSVDRALSLLELIVSKKGGISLAEIVKELSVPKTTAYRILETLRLRGFIEWEGAVERYSIGLKMLELGVTGLTSKEIVDVSSPYLHDISATTGETSFLGVYNEGEVVYLYKVEGTGSIRTSAHLGSRRPMYCTGLGKAILSAFTMDEVDRILHEKGMERKTENTIADRHLLHEELGRIRLQGWAFDNEENELGVTCFAVPIFNYTGRVVGAISCAGPAKQVRANRDIIIRKIKEYGEQISKRLGYVPSMRFRN